MDHWLRQSSNMMMLRTVCSICWRISGLILTTVTRESLSGLAWPELLDFLPRVTGGYHL